MTKEKAWKIVDTLNDILKRVPFCEGVESAAFRERRRELEADGQWGILVDRFEFRGKNLWCRVRPASTDEPEYIEVRACSDTAE